MTPQEWCIVQPKQTADIINKNRNIPIIYDFDIIERDFGEFEGMNKKDFDFIGYWSYKQNHNRFIFRYK